MKADTMNEKTIQPQDVFVELRALTEALLTRANADYLRRQVDAAIEVMAERGYSPPTPWPDEDFGVAVWGRSRASSEPGEVARLVEEAERLAKWLDAKFARHKELEDGDAAALLRRLASMATSPASEAQAGWVLTDDDVEWVVNDNAELGVKIGEQFFFLYKGYSLVYTRGLHDDDTPMHWRPVFKREFGECCHPINYANLNLIGTVSLDDSGEWKPLPPALASAPQPASSPVAAERDFAFMRFPELYGGSPEAPVAAEGQKAVGDNVPLWKLIFGALMQEDFAPHSIDDFERASMRVANMIERRFATPTASMADAAEAVARVEMLTGSLRHIAWLKEMPPVGTLLYATSGPRGENAGGVVEALSDEAVDAVYRKHYPAPIVYINGDLHGNQAVRACLRDVQRAFAEANGLRIAEKGDAS